MVPLNANQQALAAALDRARPAAGPALSGAQATIFYALYGQQDISGDASALAAISGQGQAVAPGALLDAYAGFSNVIANRQAMLAFGLGDVQAALTPNDRSVLCERRSAPTSRRLRTLVRFAVLSPAGTAPRSPWTTWGQVYGGAARVGDSNSLPGANSSNGGVVVGGDGAVRPQFRGGRRARLHAHLHRQRRQYDRDGKYLRWRALRHLDARSARLRRTTGRRPLHRGRFAKHRLPRRIHDGLELDQRVGRAGRRGRRLSVRSHGGELQALRRA